MTYQTIIANEIASMLQLGIGAESIKCDVIKAMAGDDIVLYVNCLGEHFHIIIHKLELLTEEDFMNDAYDLPRCVYPVDGKPCGVYAPHGEVYCREHTYRLLGEDEAPLL
jgi:hypothetical protein